MRNHGRGRRAEWVRIVAAFEKADLSQPEFCAARGLNLGTFRSWLYRLRREGTGAKLVEIVAAGRSTESECVVQLGGAEAHFASLPEPEYLAAVLRAVDER